MIIFVIMLKPGSYHKLRLLRETAQGAYLDDGADGVLLPKRFLPPDVKFGDEIEVFIYHDKEGRPIATTQKPYGVVGEIVRLRAVTVTSHGAFLDNGLMKDLFVPKSKQLRGMAPDNEYLVMIYLDEITDRLCATERLEPFLTNETLTVKEQEEVDLLVYRKTNIGYQVIINKRHLGVLHHNEIYRPIAIGDTFRGYIKKILPDNKIDVVAGKLGFKRVEDEAQKIVRLLQEHDGYLPYHDKSDPEAIYAFFGMSKKTFKMTLGGLYKSKKIELEKEGIKLLTGIK